MAGLKDVAQEAGVSIATASHVLRGTKTVSAAVEQRVLDAAAKLGYRPNRSARALRTGRSGVLGLLIPDLTNPYFPALVQAIETACRALGYVLLVMDTGNDPQLEAEALTVLADYQVDGVIAVPVGTAFSPEPGFPLVTVDRPMAGFDAVHADHYQGGRLLAQQALALGHTRVGFLCGPRSLTSAVQRREGFLDAAGAELQIVWEVEVPFAVSLPAPAVHHLQRNIVTLVVCANDVVAVGALRILRQHGVRVPDEVALLGFDDIPWAELLEPPLSTVRQPVADIGRRAVHLLQARIAEPEKARQLETLPVTFVSRGSTARAAVPTSRGRGQ